MTVKLPATAMACDRHGLSDRAAASITTMTHQKSSTEAGHGDQEKLRIVGNLPYNSTEADLREMFAFFFQHGAAAERFVSDPQLFEQLVAQAVF